MIKRVELNRSNAIKRVKNYAKMQGEDEVFIKFISLVYKTAPLDKIITTEVKDLFEISKNLWNIFIRHTTDDICEIFTKNDSIVNTGYILIATDSKPFIIDSIKIALLRIGLSINSYIHIANINKFTENSVIINFKQSNDSKNLGATYLIFEITSILKANIPFIRKTIIDVLDDVTNAVTDWVSMKDVMKKSITQIAKLCPSEFGKTNIKESKDFLSWLLEYYTFLGCREYEIKGESDKKALVLKKNSSLGVLKEGAGCVTQRYYCDLPDSIRKHMISKKLILVTKTNTLSTVHRSLYTDMIIIKSFDDDGNLVGEKRFVGLFTSDAYDSDPSKIPFLNQKIKKILSDAKDYHNHYDQKKLLNILKRLPRDDLFQASLEYLSSLAIGVLGLQDRRVTKLFARKDVCNRFVSCLVFLPKDVFSTKLKIKMQQILIESFIGTEINSNTILSESSLASIHFVIRVNSDEVHEYDLDFIESKIINATRSWLDDFEQSLQKKLDYNSYPIFERYKIAFSPEFKSLYSGEFGAETAIIASKLTLENNIHIDLTKGKKEDLILRAHQFSKLLPLSDAIPMLENMGMRIIGERLFEISTIDNEIVYISEFMVEYPNAKAALDSTIKAHFIDALLKIWKGYAENDRFNYLALSIGLKWEEIRIIRAYSKYLKQIGFSLSESYIQSTFEKYPVLAKNIVNLFMSKFNPKIVSNNKYSKIKRELNKLLKELDGVDQERIVKIYINLIEATVRVNLFKLKNKSDAFAIKIQSNLINILPLPKPKYEIFIFSERVEGIHLRADKVARGGIRWSNRIDDFRTEILGLMKAQNGKNSLIVPAGSKGGFIAKKLDLNMSREEIDNEVIYCYKQFISGLLDLTDNLIKDKVIKPTNVICYDEDDPYLVVAADRGTASFSDIANDLAANKYKFWLQDAFASGGSAGYDHKKMGITAKGAWQSFVWHAKEINLNINKPFTVLGIGGMAGDVFGNGMLLSKQIQLIAAFDHSYIFIDPNPDAEISFKERQRMFGVKNVNWIDYNKKLLSKGGEIYTRSSKYVEISNEAKKRFGLNKTKFGPDELINALLSAKFDLLWNGGIGTYVKSSKETNSKVGDHSNDSLRINGSNVNCKIIAEGGNLGLTQLGRIEYELIGGVVNTDFIDNSAGVDCSDHEVNIKIFLNQYLQNGQITYFDRNKLLVKMTQDVSKLVLQNTIHQNIFISLEMLSLPKYIYLYEKFIDYAEQEGVLDPEVEYLPSKQTILNRLSTGGSLTRPEMAVLFSYSKIILQSQILKTDIVNSLNTAEFLNEAFPDIMLKELLEDKLLSGGSLWNHPLRKEIIATHISNSFIHELGISFIVELNEETNKNIEDIVSAYIISRKIFNIKEILLAIDKRYSDLNAKEILFIHKSIRQFTKRCVKWLLRNNVYINKTDDQKNKLNKFIDGVNSLLSEMPYIAKGKVYDEYGMFLSKLNTISLPKHIIKEISLLNFSYAALNIVHASQKSGKNIRLFAELYFITSEKMGVYWLKNLISELNIETKWDIASSYSLKGKLDEVQRVISLNVYNNLNLKSGEVEKVFNDWFLNNKNQIKSWTRLMADLSKRKKVGFTVVYTLINELERVAQFLKELK